MAIDLTLVCDRCGRVIDAGRMGQKTAAQVRAEAKANGCKVGLPGGRDLCWDCAK